MSRRWIERDRAIAARVKEARIAAGLTQAQLAGRIGVSFQQLQKYEKATNRVTAGVLEVIAQAAGRPVAWFYAASDIPTDEGLTRMTLELMQEFTSLSDRMQRSLVTIARELRKAAA